MLRRRQPSVDVIALLALVGALVVGEPFAGSMITVMLASGRLLEARAAQRARRDLSLLAERAPRMARRGTGDGVVEIPVDEDECLVATIGTSANSSSNCAPDRDSGPGEPGTLVTDRFMSR
jgi:hypothetical protein